MESAPQLDVGRPVLGMAVHYHHRFEPQASDRTRLTWIVEGEGWTTLLVGRLFARVYENNLDRAIPRLICWYDDTFRSKGFRP
jgi:hypothetical protein